MVIYTHSGGYGNVDLEEARRVVNQYLPSGSRDKVILAELLYDYECLMRVIDGEGGAVFEHPDGSETRRLKLYGG